MMYEVENKMVVDSYWHDDWYWTDNNEPELVEDFLMIEDEIYDDLEAEFGSMEAVDEFTLADIVTEKTGITPDAVAWDPALDSIVYAYYEEVA